MADVKAYRVHLSVVLLHDERHQLEPEERVLRCVEEGLTDAGVPYMSVTVDDVDLEKS